MYTMLSGPSTLSSPEKEYAIELESPTKIERNIHSLVCVLASAPVAGHSERASKWDIRDTS